MNVTTATTVDPGEVEKFSRMAGEWWDETGTSGPLHSLNPARLRYIRTQVERHFSRKMQPGPLSLMGEGQGEGVLIKEIHPYPSPYGADLSHEGEVNQFKPFTNFTIADIGCGGGIVCEPLARLGAMVTGIDASAAAIEVAQAHAAEAGLTIDYRAITAEQLAAEGARFDVVLALEVVEHVADVSAFIAALKNLLKPNGLLIISTPNRTAKSFAAVIIGAEYILRWLPRGTHDWRRFLKPSELARELRQQGLAVSDITGVVYDPLKRAFDLNKTDVSVNYLMTVTQTKLSS